MFLKLRNSKSNAGYILVNMDHIRAILKDSNNAKRSILIGENENADIIVEHTLEQIAEMLKWN